MRARIVDPFRWDSCKYLPIDSRSLVSDLRDALFYHLAWFLDVPLLHKSYLSGLNSPTIAGR